MMSPTTMTMAVWLIRVRVRPGRSPASTLVNRCERKVIATSPIRISSPGLIGSGTARSSRNPLTKVPLVLISMTKAWSDTASSRISKWLREISGSRITSRRDSLIPTHSRPTNIWSKIGTLRCGPPSSTMRKPSGSSGRSPGMEEVIVAPLLAVVGWVRQRRHGGGRGGRRCAAARC
jgi:hypothetical protein